MQTTTTIVCNLDDLRSILGEILCDAISSLQEKQIEEERYLTAQEVTDLLHIDRSTLWRWKKCEYIIPIKVGKKNLYRKTDVESIMSKSHV